MEKKRVCGQLSKESEGFLNRLLEYEKSGEFKPSPSFEGVMIRQLVDHDWIPLEMRDYIRHLKDP